MSKKPTKPVPVFKKELVSKTRFGSIVSIDGLNYLYFNGQDQMISLNNSFLYTLDTVNPTETWDVLMLGDEPLSILEAAQNLIDEARYNEFPF